MKQFACILLFWACEVPIATGQQLRGILMLTSEMTSFTNPYLDPFIGEWNRTDGESAAVFMPMGIAQWTGEKSAVGVLGSVRRNAALDGGPHAQSVIWQATGDRRVARRLKLGATASYTHVRTASERRTGWILPYISWTAAPQLRLTLRPGLARFATIEDRFSDLGTSYLLMAELDRWTSGRWHWQVGIKISQTRTDEASGDYRGTGAFLRSTHRFDSGWSVDAVAEVEQFGYGSMLSAGGTGSEDVSKGLHDLLWKGQLSVEYPVTARFALHGRAGLLSFRETASGAVSYDRQFSLGVRFTLEAVHELGRRRLPLWVAQPEGARIQVPYHGSGKLYVVGDFNYWKLSELSLTPSEGDIHTTTLQLQPGTYSYKIQVEESGVLRWLPLPDGEATVEDGFGGVNGLLIVDPPAE